LARGQAKPGHVEWPSEDKCNAGLEAGLSVRIPCELDLRRVPAIPRATKPFERLSKGRTVSIFRGADDGNVTGARRFHAFVGAVLVVQLVFATLLAKAPRWQGTLGQTRLGPIAQALRQPVPA
jgi:hypothetical protein